MMGDLLGAMVLLLTSAAIYVSLWAMFTGE